MTTTPKTHPFKAAMPLLVALMLMLAGAFPATAQHQQQHPQRTAMQQADTTRGMMGMMPEGMMQGQMMSMMQEHMQMMQRMMQDPLRHAAMLVHVLPTMQEPLDLSDEQATQLKQRAQQFKEQKEAHQKQMIQAKEQLQELLASEDVAPDRVRTLLEEAATHQAQMQALAYETASQMKGILSDEQRTKLSEMEPMQMHHHMMANMTMMEMMQAMHGDMMPDGMMKQQ